MPLLGRLFRGLPVAGLLMLTFALFAPDALANETVTACGNNPNAVFQHAATVGISTTQLDCPGPFGLAILSNKGNTETKGTRADWEADAPAGLEIVGASVPGADLISDGLNDGGPWGGGVYWQGGGAETTDNEQSGGWTFTSPYFGFQIVCGASTCDDSPGGSLSLSDISLYVQETQGPQLVAPDGLWQANGWVRGLWPIHFYGTSPSGMCSLSATLNGAALPGGTSSGVNAAVWQQCSASAVDSVINTAAYGQGPLSLTLSGYDGAGVPTSEAKTIYVDNSTPTLSLSGPTDAPSTAGTQYVTATAGGSPSGIDGIECSVDGSPEHWYSGASAQVPVSGLGEHSASCIAFNNAVDQNGVHGVSATQTWSLKIGAPTELGVSFAKYVGLRCTKVKERRKIPGHWVTRHRHGRTVKVKTKPHHKIVKVTRCHPKTKRVGVVVRVPLRRHGKVVKRHGRVVYRKKIKHKRVPVTPHLKTKTVERVKHGHATTVNGWLGLTDGTALGGTSVQVLTAPDNGLGQFTALGTVTTAPDGTWTAMLPAGPSRLVEATYAGASTTEATASGQVRLLVPAKAKLDSVTPHRVAWGHTVRIKGQLLGGYLPPAGVNVRLRIGIKGRFKTTYGVHEHVSGSGQFKTSYTFGVGLASTHLRYWFQIASLPSGNYPYTSSSSNRIYVAVGGHPPAPRHHRHKKRR
jgi:hypothetical protein